jgi:hypothetical protein
LKDGVKLAKFEEEEKKVDVDEEEDSKSGTSTSSDNDDDSSYDMNHKRRGVAIVFNQENFETNLRLRTRPGTNKDRDDLE